MKTNTMVERPSRLYYPEDHYRLVGDKYVLADDPVELIAKAYDLAVANHHSALAQVLIAVLKYLDVAVEYDFYRQQKDPAE